MSGAGSLVAAAAMPVLQAGLLAAAGAGLAWKGVLDDVGRSTVAGLSFYCYSPALTFSTLASSMTVESIINLWPLLLNMTFSCLLGLAAGWLTARVLHTPQRYHNIVIAAIGFGNVGNLPLVFVSSLCSEDSGTIFVTALGPSCKSKGMSYVAFSMCIATLFQFTIAINMLRMPLHENGSQSISEETSRLIKHPTVSDLLNGVADPGKSSPGSQPIAFSPLELECDALPVSLTPTIADQKGRKVWRFLKDAFPMPTQAAVAGALVGCIGPVRNLFYGPSPLLASVTETIDFLGSALIPSATPLLGAILFASSRVPSHLPRRLVIGVVLVKLIIFPALISAVIYAILACTSIYSPPDPMFLLILLLVNATPSAVNLTTIAVLYGNGAEELSQILFWEYVASLLTLPIFTWIFLKMSTSLSSSR
jgi:predicted permease